MAHLWIPTLSETDGASHGRVWGVWLLADEAPFRYDTPDWVASCCGQERPRGVSIHPQADQSPDPASEELWALLAPPGSRVHVNGHLVGLGIRMLRDRDEIRLPHHPPFYFSTERLARVLPFAGVDQMFCARCRSEIVPGEPVVRCPNPSCGAWHHQGDKKCWEYSPTCSSCDQATNLGTTGYRWRPDELE